MAKRDYYEVLGVEKTADEAAIKKAYRQLAKKYHPDVNPGDKDAEARFQEINEAYSVLSDEQKRRKYDQFGPDMDNMGGSGFSGFDGFSGFGGGGFEDIFSSFFGGGAARRNGPMQGDDIQMEVTLTFEEAALGCEKEINLVRDEACPNCGGTGAKPGTTPSACTRCGGTGSETVIQNTMLGRMQSRRTCSQCRGTGKIISDPCPKCNGRGKVRTSKRRSVKIPAGIDDGQVITLRGYGQLGENGGPAGDLLLYVHVKEHKLFKRDGYDLHIEVPLTITQAALGATIDVPTLDKPIKQNIPEGTQSGTVFRVRGNGIKMVRSEAKGDLYITVRVETPRKLTDKQKKILKEFDESLTGREYEQKKTFFDRVRDAFNG